MPKIIIDARLYGPAKTGIGRYTQNLLRSLPSQKNFSRYQFGLIVKNEDLSLIQSALGDSYQYFPTTIPHYSLSEQILLPRFITQLKPDLVHFTHFNKPLIYPGLSVITIHDLIKHFYRGAANTTKNALLYWPKYFLYRLLTDVNIRHNYLIVPSHYWRNILINRFGVHPPKITVTPEAVDPKFLSIRTPNITDPQPYLLYTGNLYPHKNIAVVFRALKNLPDLTLKIICARSLFLKRAQTLARELGVSAQVEFLGFVKDSDFPKLYAHALCLVHPSLMEGFSLTGLEAMSLNCPVISSSASCLPEIYQDSVLYFDPKDDQQLMLQIQRLQHDPVLRRDLIKKGHLQVKKYSWSTTAAATLQFYEDILEKS